jgi:hypothetical protein
MMEYRRSITTGAFLQIHSKLHIHNTGEYIRNATVIPLKMQCEKIGDIRWICNIVPIAKDILLLSNFARRLPSVDGSITELTSDDRRQDDKVNTALKKNPLPKIEIIY